MADKKLPENKEAAPKPPYDPVFNPGTKAKVNRWDPFSALKKSRPDGDHF